MKTTAQTGTSFKQAGMDESRPDARRGFSGRGMLRAARLLVVPALLLAGCANTTVTGGTEAAGADIGYWQTVWTRLPVERHGSVPGTASVALAQLYPADASRQYAALGPLAATQPRDHIVLYINAAAVPPVQALCSSPELFREKPQSGRYATLTAALCQGDKTIDSVTGIALASGQSVAGLKQSFGVTQDELFSALQPGWSDWDRNMN